MIGMLAETVEGNVITSGVSTIVDLFGQVWTLMTANPLVMVFVGASLVTMTLGIFRKVKKASRG